MKILREREEKKNNHGREEKFLRRQKRRLRRWHRVAWHGIDGDVLKEDDSSEMPPMVSDNNGGMRTPRKSSAFNLFQNFTVREIRLQRTISSFYHPRSLPTWNF